MIGVASRAPTYPTIPHMGVPPWGCPCSAQVSDRAAWGSVRDLRPSLVRRRSPDRAAGDRRPSLPATARRLSASRLAAFAPALERHRRGRRGWWLTLTASADSSMFLGLSRIAYGISLIVVTIDCLVLR